jgi:hypothetical protein
VSAVILAVIVIMWAVVLVPMWLRRHETATENRSVDRFSSAMRVLSRRQPGTPDRRYVVMPKRDARPSVHVSGASAPARPTPTRPASRPVSTRPAARPKRTTSMAARRRRTFLVLASAVFLTFLLAVAGVVGWVVQILVDLVLVAFVVHLRTQAKRMAQVRVRRAPAATDEPVRTQVAPSRAPRRPAVPPAATEAAPAFAAAEVEDADSATGTDGGAAWSPVPVPRPTYTMKPRAPRRWTYAPPPAADAPAAEGAAVPEPQAAAPQPAARRAGDAVKADVDPSAETAELEVILEHRWAVND